MLRRTKRQTRLILTIAISLAAAGLAVVSTGAASTTQTAPRAVAYRVRFGTHTTPGVTYSGTRYVASVAATNTGTAAWNLVNPGRVALGYLLRDPRGRIAGGSRTAASPSAPVSPSAATTFNATFRAPSRPGTYVLRWDMARPDGSWFTPLSGSAATTDGVLMVRVQNRSDFQVNYRAFRGPREIFAYTTYTGTLAVTNTSRMTWLRRSQAPVGVAYRWSTRRGPTSSRRAAAYANDAIPGQDTTVTLRFSAPSRSGTQTIGWDLFQRGVGIFSDRGVSPYGVVRRVRYGYGARYRVYGLTTFMFPNERRRVRVVVRNASRMAWPKGRHVILRAWWTRGRRTMGPRLSARMPRHVRPGGLVRFRVLLRAPSRGGRYSLNIELAHAAAGKFSRHGVRAFGRRLPTKVLSRSIYHQGRERGRRVALTFDAGSSRFDRRILTIMRRYRVPGTAFFTGQRAVTLKRTVKWMRAHGWEIANHTWSHADVTKLSPQQLATQMRRTARVLDPLVGRRYPYMRPPYGEIDERSVRRLRKLGYRVIMWDVDTGDWLPDRGAEREVSIVMNKTHSGSIILMHFDGHWTPKILPIVIRRLRAKGYRLSRLSDVLY